MSLFCRKILQKPRLRFMTELYTDDLPDRIISFIDFFIPKKTSGKGQVKGSNQVH